MRVLAVTGASGGHIFPASSFIRALKEKNKGIETLLVLPARSLKTGILLNNCDVKYISTPAVSLKINSSNLIALSGFIKGSWESLLIIFRFRPDIIVGFGSIDSIPTIFFGWLFRIKTLIHEQNVLPGRANRLLARFVDRVAISFAKTKHYLNINQKKIFITGNPLRQELKIINKAAALDRLGLDKDKFTMLVMGGSQGSQRVNFAFLGALGNIAKDAVFQVIHICGQNDYNSLQDKYKNIPLKVKLFPFFEQMQYVYSASDLAVCRSGAATVSELIYFNLPAILIPYPFAYAHQYNNAKVLEEEGKAVIIEDKDLETAKFTELLSGLIRGPDKIGALRSNCGQAIENSAAISLAELTLSSI